MTDQISKHDSVLLSLVMSLQHSAMIQLGKVTSPATGELARDLEGARQTIDLLEMLKAKCRTDTPAPILQILDQSVMDLQMNYLDEIKKDQAEPAEGDPAAEAAAEPWDYQPVEKDAALERRFQPVFTAEPSVEDTISILRGLKEKYEVHHGIAYDESAVESAVAASVPRAVKRKRTPMTCATL